MLFIILQTFVFYTISQCHSNSVIRPRGVPLSMVSLYPTSGTFACLDGSDTIPFDRINDDYCDCESDHSDEPGTSACPNGRFYCQNTGHKGEFIPSSRVNDGICDCCDGSDEYAVWNITCENICDELGKAAREEEARTLAIIKEGSKLRVELSFKGKQIKREKQLRHSELTKDQSEAELIKKEKEEIKLSIEEKEKAALEVYKQIEEQRKKQKEEEERVKEKTEALRYFQEIDTNSDGSIDKEEIISIPLFDQDKNGIVSDEEIKAIFVEEVKVTFEHFFDNGWTYVKQLIAVNKMKENASGTESQPEVDQDLDSESPVVEHENMDENANEENDDGEYEHDEKQSENVREEDTEKENDTVEGETIEYDEDTKIIIEDANHARTEFDEADRNLRDIEREIRQLEDILNKDYGKEDEFAYLVGECYEYTDREYTYKLCPFDQVTQRPKDGGSETRLGTWGNWVQDRYEIMYFGNGQSCWNGPQRQTHVKLKCNLKTEVISASEPSRCEYLLEFHTPAVCRFKETVEANAEYHDEL